MKVFTVKLKMYQFLAPNGATGIDVQKFPCPKAFIYRGASVAHGNLFAIHDTQQHFCIPSVNRKRYPTLVYSIPVIHLASTENLLSELSCSHSHQSIHRYNPKLHPSFFHSKPEIQSFFECVHGDHPDICIRKNQQQWDYLLSMCMHNSPFPHLFTRFLKKFDNDRMSQKLVRRLNTEYAIFHDIHWYSRYLPRTTYD